MFVGWAKSSAVSSWWARRVTILPTISTVQRAFAHPTTRSPSRRRRAHIGELEAAALERARRGVLLGLAELEHRSAYRAADLAQQVLPVFRMRVEFLRRPRAPE